MLTLTSMQYNRYISFDQPSPSPFYGISDMSDDCIALLDHLDIKKAHVVGASMGGMIAQEVCTMHADRVLSMTLIYSAPGTSQSMRQSMRHRVLSTTL